MSFCKREFLVQRLRVRNRVGRNRKHIIAVVLSPIRASRHPQTRNVEKDEK